VRHRGEDSIHVKLADFGLTKESHDLVTMCGTRRYLAPEVYGPAAYTAAVDIWSLGVVVMERLVDLPDSRAAEREWCREIAKRLKDDFSHEPDGVKELLMSMVVMDPERRSSAHDCYHRAQALPDPTEDGCRTPRAGCCAEEDVGQQSNASPCDGEDQYQTEVSKPTAGSSSLSEGPTTATGQGEHPAFVRSGAPVPQSPVSAWKRARSPSTSSSTGRRRRPRRDVPTATQPESWDEGQPESREEEESSAAYLDWICDPLHALGGGSDLAADLGQESSGWSDPPPSTVDTSVPRSVPRTLQPTGPDLDLDTTHHHGIQQEVASWVDTEHLAAALWHAIQETD